jgi:hypothetical protein
MSRMVVRMVRSSSSALWIGVALLGAAARAGFAAEATEKAPSKWELEAFPYAWLAGNHGSLRLSGRTIPERTVQIDVSPSDVYGLLEDGNAFAGAGYFSATYDRFSVFTDTMGGYAEERVDEWIPSRPAPFTVRATDEMKFVIGDLGLGYRLAEWSLPKHKRPFSLGVFVGARYVWFSNDLTATDVRGHPIRVAEAVEVFEWADPMIGIRWSLPVLDAISLDFRGDIGGFGASSDLVWGLVGMVRYWVPWEPLGVHPYVAAGYRAVAFDRGDTVGNIDLEVRGPTAGAGFVF